MTHSVLTESYEFLVMMLTGGGAAVLYAVLSAVRQGKLNTFIADIIFTVITLIALFFTLQKACGGNVKFYQIAGFILGFLFINFLFRQIKGVFSLRRK